jgi:heme-degrading monooxygenase HmoA
MQPTESPVLIDLWTVDPSREQELLERIREVTRDLLVAHEGFVSAEIYESVDHTTVMVSITMRTVSDRQALTDSAVVHEALRELRVIAQSHARLFKLVETLGDAA